MKIGFIEDFVIDIDFRGKDETVILLEAVKNLAWAQGCDQCVIKADNSKNGLKFDQCKFQDQDQGNQEIDLTPQG